METVQLKDGSTVLEVTTITTFDSLKRLFGTHPIAAYEAGRIAHNPGHVPWNSDARDAIIKAGLLEPDGSMHDDVRHVIASALPGSGTRFVDPRK